MLHILYTNTLLWVGVCQAPTTTVNGKRQLTTC
jgi:hypothetical protein